MTQEYFGASQLSLVTSVITMAGQAGWTQRDWEAANSLDFWQQMKLVTDGRAEITLFPALAVAKSARQPSLKQKFISFYAKVFGLGEVAAAALRGQSLKTPMGVSYLADRLLILGDDVLPPEVVFQKIASFWPVNQMRHFGFGHVRKIIVPKGHERPRGAYILHHTGEMNPDRRHRGKYALDPAKFMTPREYAILWAYTLWDTKAYLDRDGSTRLCDESFDKNWFIEGQTNSDLRLSFSYGKLDHRPPGHCDFHEYKNGPREVSFVSAT